MKISAAESSTAVTYATKTVDCNRTRAVNFTIASCVEYIIYYTERVQVWDIFLFFFFFLCFYNEPFMRENRTRVHYRCGKNGRRHNRTVPFFLINRKYCVRNFTFYGQTRAARE